MEINEYGIYPGDIFMLNYCEINVFFRVCRTFKKSVYLYEIQTKIVDKKYETLTKNLTASKEPLIIDKKQNSITKSKYEIYPIIAPFDNSSEIVLPIKIEPDMPIFGKALSYENTYPIIGIAYAHKLNDYIGVCWEIKKGGKENESMLHLC